MSVSSDLVERFERDGFAILRKVIDPELVAEGDRHVRWLMARYPELRPEHLHHPLIRDDAFWVRLVSDERLLDIAERFLGPDLACFTAHYICKPPGDGHAVLWHQDGAYWKLEPMEALTVWLAVDATTPENGCLRMLPGSHRIALETPEVCHDPPNMLFSRSPKALVEAWLSRVEPVDICLEPGDVSIHHPHLLHGSGPNRSSHRRCGLDIGYMRSTTLIENEDLYLNPVLVRGSAPPGGRFRPWPRYDAGKTIPFRGQETWDQRASAHNERGGFRSSEPQEPALAEAHRMIRRLQLGTVRETS